MKYSMAIFLIVIFCQIVDAQTTIVKGAILHAENLAPLENIIVLFEETEFIAKTTSEGIFIFSDYAIPDGEQSLLIYGEGFLTQRIPVIIYAEQENELSPILLSEDFSNITSDVGIISLSDMELDDDENQSFMVSGFLQASKDVFLNAVAFDFGNTFFSPRGYGSEDGKLLINGMEMNKFQDGRPQWENFGGLNDVQQHRSFSRNTTINDFSFGDLAGTTNILMRASQYRQGGKISYAAGNRSYRGRTTASYNSGLLKNDWAYSVLLSRRFAQEGYMDGTLYSANSFFISVEKVVNPAHSLNFTGFFTPVRRGKSSAQTQEVFDLKNEKYNSYWGKQEGEIRNSRMRKVSEPVVMLNHYWNISENTELNTNVGYRFGFRSDSRLGYDNAPNPDPTYYQNLPSYFLGFPSEPDVAGAERAKIAFRSDGQIDWLNLYESNVFYGGPSRYYLYEDRTEDNQWIVNSIFNSEINEKIHLTASINHSTLNSHNFAKMLDLLGGNGYLDIDVFKTGSASQNDLNHPDRLVQQEEIFKYNYNFQASKTEGFAQTAFVFPKIEFNISGKIGAVNYQRNGLYRNGSYPEGNDSFGKSEQLAFSTYGGKVGFLYKFSGRHAVELHGAYFTEAPGFQNSFSNSRQNNNTVIGLTEIKKTHIDLNYLLRSPFVNLRFSGYFSRIQDDSKISFFYADGISVDDRNFRSAFIQEVLTGVETEHLGLEFGMETQITSTVKLKSAIAVGQHIYSENPNLYITSDAFSNPQFYGEALLKNYKLPGGPQQAYQLGFEYKNPKFWWFGITGNYFSNSYINVSPLTRTKNFYLDQHGIPFENYDEKIARSLLKQEKFDSYFLMNLVGGKSWRVKRYYTGFSLSVANILNQTYKTGGYEQARNSNYQTLLEDTSRPIRVFGPKYWYGYGATYHLNVYLRF